MHISSFFLAPEEDVGRIQQRCAVLREVGIINLENVKVVLAPLSQKPPLAPQLLARAGPTSGGVFRGSSATLRERTSTTLVPGGFPESLTAERASDIWTVRTYQQKPLARRAQECK